MLSYGRETAILLQRGPTDPKFQAEGVAPHQLFFFSVNQANYLSYGIKIWTDLSSVLSQFTRVTDGQTDRRTDRILIAIPRLHYMQRGKNYTKCRDKRSRVCFIFEISCSGVSIPQKP